MEENKRLPTPIEVLLNYLTENPEKMIGLLDGLEKHEYKLPSVVRTAVTCNLYKIIYGAGRLTIEYPQELADAVVSLTYGHIDAFVKSLCSTFIKTMIKKQTYNQ